MTRMSARQFSLAKYLDARSQREINIQDLSELNQLTIGSFVKRGWLKESTNHTSVRWTADGSKALRDFGSESGWRRAHPKLKFSSTLSLKIYNTLAA